MSTVQLSQDATLNVAYAIRYVVVITTVASIQQFWTSFSRERRLIWSAPASFTKYCYLLARFLPMVAGLLVFVPVSGFLGYSITNDTCAVVICMTAVIIVLCLTMNNALAVMHVSSLWDYNRRILGVLLVCFVATYGTALTLLVVALVETAPHVAWNPLVNMCGASSISSLVVVSSSVSFAFEVILTAVLCWNSVDRPRAANVPLRRALAKDGVVFFVVLSMGRALQLALASTHNAELTTLGVLSLALACVLSTIFNQRFLFAAHVGAGAAVAPGFGAARRAQRPPALGKVTLLPGSVSDDPRSTPTWVAGEGIELGRVEIELRKD